MNYEMERDKACLKFSVVLIFFGTAGAGVLDNMIENSTLSTVAIIAVCVGLLGLDRGFRWLMSRRLNKKAEKNGDPIPFDKNHMI